MRELVIPGRHRSGHRMVLISGKPEIRGGEPESIALGRGVMDSGLAG
jgi:hypothetical protein